MVFASPGWLYWLLVVPVIALVAWWLTRRDRERVARLVARPLWVRVVKSQREAWLWIRVALVCVGAAGVLLALARPQWGIIRERIEREGVDVVLVLDTSGSMATEDVKPSRFALARLALESLVSRLEGDRFALVAFEGEAYTLVPLTLDADAVGLFLDTLEPGAVPAPGTSVGRGLARGMDLFVDEARPNKVMILVSDGEDLEGDVDEAVRRARKEDVVIHTVGVGTEAGQPVPDFDSNGKQQGFKKGPDGSVVISHLNMRELRRIAQETGGVSLHITPADPNLAVIERAIEGMETKSMAREFTYRRRERFQIPLAVGLVAFLLALILPPARLWKRRRSSGVSAVLLAIAALAALAGQARAGEQGRVVDELLLRPKRFAREGRSQQKKGDHPGALKSYEAAQRARPKDPHTTFDVAGALYKNGKYDEAAQLFRALAADPKSDVAAASRFNLGDTLYQKKDYAGAVQAFRDTLRMTPDDGDAKRNLELSLRALQMQKEQQKRQQQNQQNQQNKQQKPSQGQQGQQKQKAAPRPLSQKEQEEQRFEKETGMPKERAMQLLDALQRNEEDEQRKELAAKRATRKGDKDW